MFTFSITLRLPIASWSEARSLPSSQPCNEERRHLLNLLQNQLKIDQLSFLFEVRPHVYTCDIRHHILCFVFFPTNKCQSPEEMQILTYSDRVDYKNMKRGKKTRRVRVGRVFSQHCQCHQKQLPAPFYIFFSFCVFTSSSFSLLQ